MATEYTTNYNLDKYSANDRPNLRDQYNSAMEKIDAALTSISTQKPDVGEYLETRRDAATLPVDVTVLGANLYVDPQTGVLFYKQ